MAKGMKSLAKDTAIYGISSILGKFLNWLLTPFYTFYLATEADNGIVTNFYAWSSLLLVILTYGMETGYFRFANKNRAEAPKVYGNSLISVGFTSVLFALMCAVFTKPIAGLLNYTANPEFITMMGLIVALDAFSSIIFAHLRYKNRPIKFAVLKFLYVVLNIFFNLFFLMVCPWLMQKAPSLVNWFYVPGYGVGYVFISNLLATIIQTLILSKHLFEAEFKLDLKLLNSILKYSFPLLILGIAGIANQNLDKILFPYLREGNLGKSELGIYGVTSKMSMVMMMFTQAFRFAYEPFVFAQHKEKNSLKVYADAMKYFIIFSFIIFIGMVLYVDVFKLIIKRNFWVGLDVLPIILVSFIFQGIYFNLSLWYKLTDKTIYGAWFSIIGTVIIVMGNIIFVPLYSYWGSAWSAFGCYFFIMLISYFVGQKYMPIKYDMKSIGLYTGVTIVLYVISLFINTPHLILNVALKSVLMIAFLVLLVKRDFPLKSIPYINKFFNK